MSTARGLLSAVRIGTFQGVPSCDRRLHDVILKWRLASPPGLKVLSRTQVVARRSPKNTLQAPLVVHGKFRGQPRSDADLYGEQTNKRTLCIIVRHTIMCTRAVVWICGTRQYETGCDFGAFRYYIQLQEHCWHCYK